LSGNANVAITLSAREQRYSTPLQYKYLYYKPNYQLISEGSSYVALFQLVFDQITTDHKNTLQQASTIIIEQKMIVPTAEEFPLLMYHLKP
jgi:hypothetical protein